jgi:hypothetical protein
LHAWSRFRVVPVGDARGVVAVRTVAIRIVAGLLALSAVACGDPDITGTWSGVGTAAGSGRSGNLAMNMKLTESDDSVTGSGTARGTGGTIPFTVSGSSNDDNVNLTLTTTGGGVGTYNAAFDDDDTISGTYSDVLVTMALTLKRE